MQRSHKIKLIPNKTQIVALKKAVGCARFAYNWGLATWKEQYELSKEGKAEKPDAYKISKLWTQHKPDWAYESPKDASQRSILNLGKAYCSFWNGKTQIPSFKKKGAHDSFYISNDRIAVTGKRVKVTKLGNIKLTEELRFKGKIMSATFSNNAGNWYVAVTVNLPDSPMGTNPAVVGVDVGIKSIAVASDGTSLENPRLLQKYSAKLVKAQRTLSRKQARSGRQHKAQMALQKIHSKITNTRNDAIHKFTTNLAKNHGTAVIENLDIAELKTKGIKWLSCLLQDTAMQEVHRQLQYKMKTLKAPKFYASSKTCSHCGHKVSDLPLSVRTYRCKACGFTADRDLNAAFNLRNMRWVTA